MHHDRTVTPSPDSHGTHSNHPRPLNNVAPPASRRLEFHIPPPLHSGCPRLPLDPSQHPSIPVHFFFLLGTAAGARSRRTPRQETHSQSKNGARCPTRLHAALLRLRTPLGPMAPPPHPTHLPRIPARGTRLLRPFGSAELQELGHHGRILRRRFRHGRFVAAGIRVVWAALGVGAVAAREAGFVCVWGEFDGVAARGVGECHGQCCQGRAVWRVLRWRVFAGDE